MDETCPACGAADPAPIAYGLLGPEGFAAAERGEVVLGGCVEWGDDPDRQCRACHHRWARPWPGFDEVAPPQ